MRAGNQHTLSRYELLPEKRIIKKPRARNIHAIKSVDSKHIRNRIKRSRSPTDDELYKAEERIRKIQMISMLREEKLKAEFKVREH